MTSIVILPGLTGTRELLRDFADALQSRCPVAHVTAVAYPTDHALDYAQLEQRVRAILPKDEPCIVTGESFSGPIALSLALDPPPGLRAITLCASFACFPSRLSPALAALARYAPMRALPLRLLAALVLGPWSNARHQAAFKQALAAIPSEILRFRAQQALRIDLCARLPNITLPVLYLRASRDRLMPRSAGEQICAAIPTAELREIEGPHFLLQAKPDDCARAVAEFARRIGG
jgi:pimeloyl-ACP methyl ester carboxylesterase